MKRLNSYSAYLAFCGLCLSSPSLNANPEGGTVVNGSATFNQQGSTLTVTNTPGTIIIIANPQIAGDHLAILVLQFVPGNSVNDVH